MGGPLPKPAATRQRRNKAATRATLPTEAEARKAKVPQMPKRRSGTGSWHPRVKEWWQAIWKSPMGGEFLSAERQRLTLIAELQQQFWTAADRGGSVTKLATEIRQQEAQFGLTPLDRRRLQWEVDRGEAAEQRITRRRSPKADPKKDPRSVLKAV